MQKLLFILILFFTFEIFATIVNINEQAPVYSFVNHQIQITELRDKLLKTNNVGITGITGKGKSELARKYLEHYKDQYEIIAFLNADTDLIPQYIELAKDINKNICIKEKCLLSTAPNEIKKDLMNFLDYRSNWLLIYDNLQINQNNKIKDIINWNNKGHIIITTQDTEYIKNRIEVPYLTNEDSKILIKKIMGDVKEEIIEKIIRECKGYPYLINHISTFIANYKHKNVDEVIEYINKYNNPLKGFTELLLASITDSQQELLLKISLLDNQGVSRNLLNHLMSYKLSDISNDIHELIRLGVLEQINSDINNQIFRLHDVLKNQLIEKFSKEIHKKNTNIIIDLIIKILPKNSISKRYDILSQDKTMISNLEKLLINADLYEADFYKSMELRKYIVDYYLGIRDYVNWKQYLEWLQQREHKINLSKISDEQKDVYAYYITRIGFYEEMHNNYKGALEYYKKALNIANMTKEYMTQFVASMQLAQCYITIGDIVNTSKSLEQAKTILTISNNEIKDDIIWYVEAKTYLAQGQYETALQIVEKGIKQEGTLKESMNAGNYMSYLLLTEIYNSNGSYHNAYKIAQEMDLHNKKHLVNRNLIEARILTQLSRAELGLNKKEEALKHALKSIQYLLEKIKEEDISASIDKNLADSYTVLADIYVRFAKLEEAIKFYDKAENIYYNRYNLNINNMDEVSYTLAQGAKAACEYGSKEWYARFKDNLTRYFGFEHYRVKEVESYCDKKILQ